MHKLERYMYCLLRIITKVEGGLNYIRPMREVKTQDRRTVRFSSRRKMVVKEMGLSWTLQHRKLLIICGNMMTALDMLKFIMVFFRLSPFSILETIEPHFPSLQPPIK